MVKSGNMKGTDHNRKVFYFYTKLSFGHEQIGTLVPLGPMAF